MKIPNSTTEIVDTLVNLRHLGAWELANIFKQVTRIVAEGSDATKVQEAVGEVLSKALWQYTEDIHLVREALDAIELPSEFSGVQRASSNEGDGAYKIELYLKDSNAFSNTEAPSRGGGFVRILEPSTTAHKDLVRALKNYLSKPINTLGRVLPVEAMFEGGVVVELYPARYDNDLELE